MGNSVGGYICQCLHGFQGTNCQQGNLLVLPVQSVPITTKIVNSNLIHGEVYLIQHYVIKFVIDL